MQEEISFLEEPCLPRHLADHRVGTGAIPTMNTPVAQFAVPRTLLGVAIGAIFFSK
jgi:hypothetical protein